MVYFADSLEDIDSIIKNKRLEINIDECCFYYGNSSNKTDFAKNHKKINTIDAFTNINSDKRFLFTTIALDNGIDIKDFKVKHIICNVFDFDSVVQCFGRKRVINKDDSCTFYVVVPGNNELENRFENIKADIAEIDLFKKSPNKWEISDSRRTDGRLNKSKFVYYDPNNLDVQGRPIRTLNSLAEEKAILVKKELEHMLGVSEDNKTMPYETLLRQKLNIDYKKCHNINEHPVFKAIELERQQSLMRFLHKHKDKELDDDSLKELTKLCGIVTKSIKGIAQPKRINDFFNYNKINYSLINKQIRTGNHTWKSVRVLIVQN